MSQEVKISAKGVNFFYGDFHALKDITLEIYKSRVTALIGPSGCGKSTFLRCLNRMNDLIQKGRLEGQICLDNQNIYAPDVDVVMLRRKVGMVFQKPNPFPKTIFENVAYGLRVNGVKDRDFIGERVEESLKRAALWNEVRDRLFGSALDLSGGQQQRLCIARALAVEPAVLLMDEPSRGIDIGAKGDVFRIMRSLAAQGIGILFVTSDLDEVLALSDRVAVMSQGRLTALFDRAEASEATIVAASSIGHGPAAASQRKELTA